MKRQAQAMSLRQFTYRHISLLLVAMILSFGVNLWVIQKHTNAVAMAQNQHALNQHATYLGQQIEFYRDVLKRLAKQSRVRDMLTIVDATAAQDWAITQRDYLPNSIGMALIGTEKQVMGLPVELHLGPSCIRDLGKKLMRQPDMDVLVHRDNPKLAHFDLTEPVKNEFDEMLGVLFVSFSLDSLKTALTNSVQKGDVLILRDGLGQMIAQAGSSPDALPTLNLSTPVPGSGWSLELVHPKDDNKLIYLALGGANLLISILIIVIFIVLTNTMVRIFVRELTGIQMMLSKITEGAVPIMPSSMLKEAQEIAPIIHAIALDIHGKQMQLTDMSMKDELTQLPNRRSFNFELGRACHLAQRGVGVTLLYLDVDHFKRINDVLGHEAGDRVLQLLSDCLRNKIRQTDISARLGGDEFAVIFTNMNADSLKLWMDSLSADFAAAQQGDQLLNQAPRCTLSAGAAVSTFPSDDSPAELLRRSDKALYQAKEQGRNCVVINLPEKTD